VARGSYDLRGVEISITGMVVPDAGGLALSGPHLGNPLPLQPLGATAKVQFDRANNRPQLATPQELSSFDRLAAAVTAQGAGNPRRITGVLAKESGRWVLHVRNFSISPG
jgi:galactose oxidase